MLDNHNIATIYIEHHFQNIKDLRDFDMPPTTYKKYYKLPDGRELYMGEYPTPTTDDLRMGFNNSRRK